MSDISDDIWYCWGCAWSGSSETAASKHSGTVGGHIVSQARLRPQTDTPASDALKGSAFRAADVAAALGLVSNERHGGNG